MNDHLFIFTPCQWLGSGEITFSMAEDAFPFTVQWVVEEERHGVILLTQHIDVVGLPEKRCNTFLISNITQDSFSLVLENPLVGKVHGSGLIEPKRIAWEFRGAPEHFEGFEVYERQRNGSYKMRAEFTAGKGLRTLIHGEIKPLV